MEVLRWPIDPALVEEMRAHYKTKTATASRGKTGAAISQEFTFDDVAPDLSWRDCEAFLRFAERSFLHEPLCGAGIELGAGPGTWSAIIARSPRVAKVYALDACEPIVALADIVVPAIAGAEDAKKVVPVVGDFDRLALPDASLDFAFDFFSLHHSTNLAKTFAELYRILRPGGILLGFDKARPDYLTETELDAMLDVEYPADFKVKMGLKPNIHHTRRMNGENEYRLKDWRAAFLDAGFSRVEHFNIARTASSNAFVAAGKHLLAALPPRLQAFLLRLAIDPAKRRGVNLSADHRVYSHLGEHFPKEISVLIATK